MSMQQINSEILDLPVEGANLQPGSLRDQLGDRPTLLVFLRHFG
jgi:hypothetical protein